MDNEEKARIMDEHALTNSTIAALSKLEIYADFIRALSDDDFVEIQRMNVYISIIYSPSSTSIIRMALPAQAQIISVDANTLSHYEKNERISILLHELGHAFNPNLRGQDAEFAADDLVIARGFGSSLRTSLQRMILESPTEFDKPLNHARVRRIP